ncbi:MAG: metallopeptidase TldD-related protein [Acidobacteriota bacterium]|nr:metallopeptidase TldD-related protein [Acidobacteriota bacterium]
MNLLDTDLGSICRCLDLVSADPEAIVDCYFERSEESGLVAGAIANVEVHREEGFAVRLVAGDGAFIASRDRIDGDTFLEALRRTARRMATGMVPTPRLRPSPWPRAEPDEAMPVFGAAVARELRRRRLAFPHRLVVRHHRRWLQVVGRELVGDVESEAYFSVRTESEAGRWGALLPDLGAEAASRVARALGAGFRARDADSPEPGRCDLVLGAPAAAVLLHEAAHALEIDTLAVTGNPDSAVGFRFGSECLDLLDDPAAAPETVKRRTDDEGVPVLRRWLLRGGLICQPLADRRWAAESPSVSPGAARRQSRHWAPGPRSHHLELVAGTVSGRELVAGVRHGLFAAEATRGWLDPSTGAFELSFAHGRKILGGELTERVGPFALRGKVGLVLGSVAAVADRTVVSGAGWCAKGGQKLPVWGTSAAMLLEGVDIVEGQRDA